MLNSFLYFISVPTNPSFPQLVAVNKTKLLLVWGQIILVDDINRLKLVNFVRFN